MIDVCSAAVKIDAEEKDEIFLELTEVLHDVSSCSEGESSKSEDCLSDSDDEGMRKYVSHQALTLSTFDEDSPIRETKLVKHNACENLEDDLSSSKEIISHSSDSLAISKQNSIPATTSSFFTIIDQYGEHSDENHINYSKTALNIPSSKNIEISPLRSPYTPSKRRQSGKYLYVPFDTLESEEKIQSSCDHPPCFKDLRDPSSCKGFLQECKSCSVVSFELILRPIPIAVPRETRKIVDRWGALICWAESGSDRKKVSVEPPFVITGVALHFGGDSTYYLPLPCPLPPMYKDSSSISIETAIGSLTLEPGIHASLIEILPSSCKELICRFVGFDGIFSRCSGLVDKLLKVNHSTLSCNPLLSVSTNWAHIARIALMQEWLKGRCVEWVIFGDIMANPSLTKVSRDLVWKLAGLRERDVVSCGRLYDPLIGIKLLSQNSISIDDNTATLSWKNPTSSSIPSQKSCLWAANTFSLMEKVDRALKASGMYDIYRNIETPLLLPIADMVYCGVPVDWAYFGKLSQYLSERKHEIDYLLEKSKMTLNPTDFSRTRARLMRELEAYIEHRADKEMFAGVSKRQKMTNSELRRIVEFHPLIQLQSEGKAIESMLTMLRGITKNKMLHPKDLYGRVRAKYNTLGTETGDFILKYSRISYFRE